MPFIKKKELDRLVDTRIIEAKLQGEFNRHNEFVKKYEGTFASRNREFNFTELKSKRDLLAEILVISIPEGSEMTEITCGKCGKSPVLFANFDIRGKENQASGNWIASQCTKCEKITGIYGNCC